MLKNSTQSALVGANSEENKLVSILCPISIGFVAFPYDILSHSIFDTCFEFPSSFTSFNKFAKNQLKSEKNLLA